MRICVVFLLIATAACAQNSKTQVSTPEASKPEARPAAKSGAEALKTATAAFHAGSFDAALESYTGLANDAEVGSQANAGVVRVLLAEEKVKAAEEWSQKGLQHFPDSADSHSAAGDVQFRTGHIGAAEKEYIAALNLKASDAHAHLGLNRVYTVSSYFGRAFDHMVRAHDLDPTDPEIRRRYLMLLPPKQRSAALRAYAAEENGPTGPERAAMLEYAEFLEKRTQQARPPCRQVNKLERAETPLQRLYEDPKTQEGWGLELKLNQAKVKLLLDTGASGILVNRRSAERAGVTRFGSVQVGGIGDAGERNASIGYVDSIKIGDLEFQNCAITITDKNLIGRDGLIGTDVFASYLVDLNMPAERFIITPLPKRPNELEEANQLNTEETPEEDETGAAPAGSASAPHHPKDRYVAPEMAQFTPVFRFGHAIMLPTRINRDDGPSMLFLVDTGSTTSNIDVATARPITHITETDAITIKGLSGEVKKVYVTDDVSVHFGRYRTPKTRLLSIPLIGMSQNFGTEMSGILGFPLLSMFDLKIDYRDGLVDFEYQGHH